MEAISITKEENILIDKFVFKYPPEYYTGGLNPSKDYLDQSSIYISKMKNIPLEDARMHVKNKLKESFIKNPIVKFKSKQDNGDMIIEEMPLTKYIQDAQDKNQVMVPSFTCYKHPSEEKSLHAEFININVKARSVDKKLAFKYYLAGDYANADIYSTSQLARKIFNNSLSGAYASMGTLLYNPSAHYSLTSITRCVSSIGNAVTESIVAGNKMFMTPDTIFNYISCVITKIDMNAVKKCKELYNLHVPTVDEIMKMITKSSDRYFNIPDKILKIKEYVSKLNDYEKMAVMYVNDLWHMKEYNSDVIKNILGNMNKKVKGYSINKLDDINNTQEGIMNLVHHICANDIRGMNVDYGKMEEDPKLDILASTAKHLAEEFTKHKLLIQTFFSTPVMPPNIAYIRKMLRDCIVLSDTDSTCGSYDKWVEWFYGKFYISEETVGLGAIVMTINTQVMDHYLKILSGNMNIDKDRVELLKMKNEFYWNSFTPMNQNKHYFADTAIKEGNVFKNTLRELKGVHLIASSLNPKIREYADKLMDDITNKFNNREQLPIKKYIKYVADVERMIIKGAQEADTSILSTDVIKDKNSYKITNPLQSPYRFHLMWNEVFGEKYGMSEEPSYYILKVPTILNNKQAMEAYLESIDSNISEKLIRFMSKANMKEIGVFRPPLHIIKGVGLPDEFKLCLDYNRIVNDNCLIFYTILEAIGFCKKPGLLISEQGY